jgi:hypothetical protein
MIDKPISLDELGPRSKPIGPFRRANVLAVAGIATVLLFISKTVGTTQELPTVTQGAAHQVHQASPGQWLIDDIARERIKFRAKFKVKQANPMPATNTAPTAPVGAGVGLRSSNDTRAAMRKRGAEKVTGPIGPLGFRQLPSSESRAGSDTLEAENGRLGAALSHRPVKPSDEHGATRANSSRGFNYTTTRCLEAPVGQAPEGEHWYYRLDRETQRKCWYFRTRS